VLIGGHSPAALDRAARIGDGWISAPMSAGRLSGLLDSLRQILDSYGTHDSLHKVASATFASESAFAHATNTYRGLGVDHLQVVLDENDPHQATTRIHQIAAVAQS
jgi:alkanesulfonate monooxygenase SsuD/methylene tetrahydromethanopterin reductase-like flavin-dependent oxidoreductase (luciferase family)